MEFYSPKVGDICWTQHGGYKPYKAKVISKDNWYVKLETESGSVRYAPSYSCFYRTYEDLCIVKGIVDAMKKNVHVGYVHGSHIPGYVPAGH